MSPDYTEIGGARWGQSFWNSFNMTWPFAKLKVTRDQIRISIGLIEPRHSIYFKKREINGIRRQGVLFGLGIVIEHRKMDYPPFILFWTFRYRRLKAELERLGYTVLN